MEFENGNYIMKNDQSITVALSVYNGEETIGKAIEHILDQTYVKLKLFVVNDGSVDNTKDEVIKYLQNDSRLYFIELDKNIGTYAAKNLILKEYTQTEFFAHQDADDYSWKRRFEKQVKFLNDNPEIAACGTCIDEYFDEIESEPKIPSQHEIYYDNKKKQYHRQNDYSELIIKGSCFDDEISDLTKLKIAMNGSILFRSKVLFELGGFDGRTPIAGDSELLWRLNALYGFGNLQEVLYSRLFHKKSLTQSDSLGYNSNNRIQYMAQAKENMIKLKYLVEHRKTDELHSVIKQDFYVPDIDYIIFNGGIKTKKKIRNLEEICT